ncbi:class I SAM-dependent methyltransferase [Tepidiforma sp.]|uniref:class I SAM-dependent methyltransferase n=1 Tax=Tepidiforma sp. TaxID=2682230 RepID=UPI002ADE885C|nr:methyltransferase domain-containing protein [Tepidiforma sp.]
MSALPSPLQALADDYAAWWIDLLGEHNHVGGIEATRWLLKRADLGPGRRMLDAGAFVGAAARLAVERTGCTAIATDLNSDFLAAGRAMEGGRRVQWVVAENRRLPFRSGSIDSIWALDTELAPAEFTRVAAPGATLCLCCEAPADARGGLDAFFEEWEQLGWELAAHRPMTTEAAHTWRTAEAELVRRRPYFEPRYGTRAYLAQLDLVAHLVQSYERLQQGHALVVFRRRAGA